MGCIINIIIRCLVSCFSTWFRESCSSKGTINTNDIIIHWVIDGECSNSCVKKNLGVGQQHGTPLGIKLSPNCYQGVFYHLHRTKRDGSLSCSNVFDWDASICNLFQYFAVKPHVSKIAQRNHSCSQTDISQKHIRMARFNTLLVPLAEILCPVPSML